MTLEIIENELKLGQVSPQRLIEMSDWLAAHSSSLMDSHEGLIQDNILYFNNHRGDYKSDRATEKAWESTTKGIELRIAETTQKRITMLLRAISRNLRVKEMEARNLF